jgi:hypothetical protein
VREAQEVPGSGGSPQRVCSLSGQQLYNPLCAGRGQVVVESAGATLRAAVLFHFVAGDFEAPAPPSPSY